MFNTDRSREDSDTTYPANLSSVWSSLLPILKEKLSAKTFASSRSRDTKVDKAHVQSSQNGHVTDQEAKGDGSGLTTSSKDDTKSLNANANSHKVLEESLSNTEYREPMIASLYV